MSNAAAPPTETPTPRVVQAEERIAMASELAELGVALSRSTVRRAIKDIEAPLTLEPVAEGDTPDLLE